MKTITIALVFVGGSFLGFLPSSVAIAQSCTSLPPSTPAVRFAHHGNGTVTDQQTGLMWKQCLEGQTGVKCLGIPEVMSWDAASRIARQASSNHFAGFVNWRLPTVQELESIVEKQCQTPAINLDVFLHSPSKGVWSMSESSYNAWSIDFGNGTAFQAFKAGGKYVRLVRDAS